MHAIREPESVTQCLEISALRAIACNDGRERHATVNELTTRAEKDVDSLLRTQTAEYAEKRMRTGSAQIRRELLVDTRARRGQRNDRVVDDARFGTEVWERFLLLSRHDNNSVRGAEQLSFQPV